MKWKGYNEFENSLVLEADMGNARQAIRDYLSSLPGKSKARRGSGVRP